MNDPSRPEPMGTDAAARGHDDLDLGRRNLLKITGASLAAMGVGSAVAGPALAQYNGAWDKTFPKSDRVDHRKVSYNNRLGIRLVADLYVPKAVDRSKRHPAVIVGHPFGGVKEQTSGLYAQTMAERGFITLAHDASYGGESGGEPRSIASPEAYIEDFSAGVDFLGVHDLVDRNRIGVIGVCASGGFALAAAQIDPRMRAIATVALQDQGSSIREGRGRTMSDADRRRVLQTTAEQRWVEFAGGEIRYRAVPEVLPQGADPATQQYFDYYRTARGRHPRSTTAISMTSNGAMFQFRPLDHVGTISPRPVLVVAGSEAHTLYYSEEAFANAREPKELFIVPGARHVDLYDRVDLIPFDKLASFFGQHLT